MGGTARNLVRIIETYMAESNRDRRPSFSITDVVGSDPGEPFDPF
jgi:hypothetical protein